MVDNGTKAASTITDAQIRALFDKGEIDEPTYRGAILVPAHHGSMGRRVRRECRRKCIEALTARSTR